MEDVELSAKKMLFDIGWLKPEQDERLNEYERMQQKIRDDKLYEEYKASGVPQKFWSESFDTYKEGEVQTQKYAKSKVIEFAKNPKNKILILCGNNGCGKSHLACSVIRQCGGEYITSPFLCMKYESAIGYKVSMNREELIAHYSKVKMLVIDECCKYFLNSEVEKFVLMQIICMRYENNLPTVLVTNSDKESFVKFLGKAVYDRFTESCTTLTFDWESRRASRRENA